jgi:hypothetical protein
MIKIDTCGQLTVNRTSGEIRNRWSMLSNPLKMWVRDTFEPDAVFHTYPKQKLFDDYSNYCENTDVPVKKRINTEENFGRKLPGEGFVSVQEKDPENKKKKIWVWRTKMVLKADVDKLVDKKQGVL